MADTVRGLFRCVTEAKTRHSGNPKANVVRTFTFYAEYDTSIPEEQRYAQYTPSGKLEITVDNSAITWEIGKAYYLDITPIEDAASQD